LPRDAEVFAALEARVGICYRSDIPAIRELAAPSDQNDRAQGRMMGKATGQTMGLHTDP